MRATYLAELIGCRTQKPAPDFVSEGVTGSARALLARTCAVADVRIFQVGPLDKAFRGAHKGRFKAMPSST